MRVRTAFVALALAAAAVLGAAAPASAHDQLLSTSPDNGTTVQALPDAVSLTFSDTVTDAGGEANQVRVLDASCQVLNDGALQVQDNVVTQPVAGSATGPVTVQWRVVSRDGHPVSGEFSFTVGSGAAPSASSDCASASPVAGEQGATAANPLPFVIVGIIVVVVIAGVVVLLASRSRRPDDQ